MSNGFIVDTHLLRELGDLLVGRDSTAILELVKNGFDADATVVRIDARNLNRPELATLTVSDDGNGMTRARFESAFLRIAGRDKEDGERRSERYQRTYTGQKGIGRLASQKLARQLEISSQPNEIVRFPQDLAVQAKIDWDEIDKQDRLDQLDSGLLIEGIPLNDSLPSGTSLTLRKLKRQWSRATIATFINELQTAQPPEYLCGTDALELNLIEPPLLSMPLVREAHETDPGFRLELSGDLEFGDELWTTAAADFSWCVDIEVATGVAKYSVIPTQSYKSQEPLARSYRFQSSLSDASIRFQARFFVLPNASARKGPLKGFVRSNSGIRIYMEGFRVLPYGEYGDDWLEIDRDYRGGARFYEIQVDDELSDEVEIDRKEALNATTTSGYYGAVFLTTRGVPALQSLVNREGFVPGPIFDAVREIVQNGVRLSVRVRRSIFNQRARLNSLVNEPGRDVNQTEPEVRDGPRNPLADGQPRVETTPNLSPVASTPRAPYEVLSRQVPSSEGRLALSQAVGVATLIAESLADDGDVALDDVATLLAGFQAARESLDKVASIESELRILAGVGLQLGAFVHDINGMLSSITTIRELLADLLESGELPNSRKQIQVIHRASVELAHVLSRQSSYLTDVLSADPRRRRSRTSVRDRADVVLRFLSTQISKKSIEIQLEMNRAVKTPPMFPAELSVLLTNVLTNAVKNCIIGGRIRISGEVLASGQTAIVVSNDGVIVDLSESERWFLPFESTTVTVDEVLGQGLGLGLPIVRAIADDYQGDVRFIKPESDFSTTLYILLGKKA